MFDTISPTLDRGTALDRVLEVIEAELRGGSLEWRALGQLMTQAFGAGDCSGAWDWRLAGDLVQTAAIRLVREVIVGHEATKDQFRAVEEIEVRLPTETRRSEQQVRLSQFSTPLPVAYIAAQAARITCADTLLDPSAGIGALVAVCGATPDQITLNEIDPTRADLLEGLWPGRVSRHDGEFIDDLADDSVQPSVVLINPPFSSSGTRSGDQSMGLRHLISAGKRLREGGRMVAIVPPNVHGLRLKPHMNRLLRIVTPVARIALERGAFRRVGTSVETEILVFDKPLDPDNGKVVMPELVRQSDLADIYGGSWTPPRLHPAPRPTEPTQPLSTSPVKTTAGGRAKTRLMPGKQNAARAASAPVPVEFTTYDTARANVPVSDVYARYAPQRVEFDGAADHPTPLVESLAMGSVAPPAPDAKVTLSLPPKVIKEGLLSSAQLETLLMAETCFAQDLPGEFRRDDEGMLQICDPDRPGEDNAFTFRRGYFLGDGTGCGKGRQVAGLILAGWQSGRRRAIWVSRSAALIEDAIRDWTDLGGAKTDIHALSKWKADDNITLRNGILFVTYSTLRAQSHSGRTRLDQILNWLGDDYDGVIAFDEAHAMQNAGPGESSSGRVRERSRNGIYTQTSRIKGWITTPRKFLGAA